MMFWCPNNYVLPFAIKRGLYNFHDIKIFFLFFYMTFNNVLLLLQQIHVLKKSIRQYWLLLSDINNWFNLIYPSSTKWITFVFFPWQSQTLVCIKSFCNILVIGLWFIEGWNGENFSGLDLHPADVDGDEVFVAVALRQAATFGRNRGRLLHFSCRI